MLEPLFLQLLNMSFTAGVVIIFVLAARLPLKKAPKVFSYALWSAVLFRLVCPFSFESFLSLLPVRTNPIAQDIVYAGTPQIDTGITTINQAVNSLLPPATPSASVNPLQIWIFLGSRLWLLGVAALLLYSLAALLRLKRRLRGAALYEDRIFLSSAIDTAFVMGIFRPRIYLPANVNAAQRAYILLHEQTHIRRLDHIVKLVGFLVLCVHWFNPLVWLAFFASGRDMEMSCDEAVIRRLGSSVKKDYSAALLTLATGRRIIGGVPLAFGEGDTRSRIKNVLGYKKPALWAVVVVVIAIIFVVAGLTADPKKDVAGFPGVNAVILTIDRENQTMTVRGTDENSVIGDRCILTWEGEPFVTVATNSASTRLSLNDFGVGDSVRLFIGAVRESYPTQATATTIQLREKAAADINAYAITFPAYDQRTDNNAAIFDIAPFELRVRLPQGWTIGTKSANDLNYPLIGAWTPLGIYDDQGAYIGAVGYNIYEEYEGAEDVAQAIYNQIALGNGYRFDAQPKENGRGAYQPVAENANGVTAVTEVVSSAQLRESMGVGDSEGVNRGILSYNRALRVYIAMELDGKKVPEEALLQIAGSVEIVR